MKLGSQKRELLCTCHWLSSQIPAGRDVPQLSGRRDLTLRPPAGRRFSLCLETAQPMKIHCTSNSQFPPMDFLFTAAPRNFPFSSVRVFFPFSLKKKNFFLNFFVTPYDLWDLIFLIKDRTHSPCIGSSEC